jgi:glycosyltransferase involved in cell wall biosynthesis
MKIAYFCEPQVGGTFSFFKRVRPHLLERGIDFRCIPPLTAECFPGTPYADLDGVDYVSFPDHPARATAIMIRHLEEQGYDAVMILPGTDITFTNIVRYLPRRMRTLARVPMFTRGSYGPAQALNNHIDVFIGVCHRIATDLTERYGVSSEKITVIYNGVKPPEQAEQRGDRRSMDDPFQIVFSGRLTDSHKGIFMLPEIMAGLLKRGIDARLMIVGDGPDCNALKAMLQNHSANDCIRFAGSFELHEVENALRQANAFVLPSRYEGCPNALLEAMAAGCACVVSRLAGSTDHIVQDGVSGCLATVGAVAEFEEHLAQLAYNPERETQMGRAAMERVRAEFSIERTATEYARVILSLLERVDQRPPPENIQAYSIPNGLRPTWRTRIPDPLKNLARTWLERFGISS